MKSSWNLHNYPSLSPNSSKNGVCIIQVPWVHRILNSMHTKFLGRYAIFHDFWKASFQKKWFLFYRCDWWQCHLEKPKRSENKMTCANTYILLCLIRVNAWHFPVYVESTPSSFYLSTYIRTWYLYRWIPWIVFRKVS